MSNPRLPLGPDSLATLSSWLEMGGQVWRHRPLPSPAHSVLMAHFHQAIFWLQFGFPCNHSGARTWASWTNNTRFPSARQGHSGLAKRRTRPWIMMMLQRCSQRGLMGQVLLPLASLANTKELWLSCSISSSSPCAHQEAGGMALWVGKSLFLCPANPSLPSSPLLISRKALHLKRASKHT